MPRRLDTRDRVVLLLSIVPFLNEHGPTTVTQLARAFDVDETTLRSLVRFLGTAGIPGETLTYQHEDLFDIDWDALETHDIVSLVRVVGVDDTPRFSSLETAAIIAGLQAVKPVLPVAKREVADSAAAKLATAAPVQRAPATVSVTPERHDQALSEIAAAIDLQRQLEFRYLDSAGNETARRVDPVTLMQSGDSWYLRAHCHERNAERTFLVDRIRNPRVLGVSAAPHERAPSQPAAGFDIVHAAITARVRVRRSSLHRIADFAPRSVGEPSHGWQAVEVDLLHPAVAVRLVQLAPGSVIVDGPTAARDAVAAWAERALAQYDV